MTTTPHDSVLYHGKVEKIGADGSSLPRSVFVTPSALLVALPAGGVTRTITLANMIELRFVEREIGSGFRCTVRARNEPVLILDFANHDNMIRFTDAVRGAASHVRMVHSSSSSGGVGDNLRERHITLDVPRPGTKGVRFVEPPEFSRPSSSPAVSSFAPGVGSSSNSYNSNSNSNNTTTHHRLSSPSTSVIPIEPLEGVGTSSRETRRVGLFDLSPDTHISPFRRESFLHALGSPSENNASMQTNRSINGSGGGGGGDSSYHRKVTPPYINNTSVLYENDITRPLSQQQSPASWTQSLQSPERTRLQEDSLKELRAQRDTTTSIQQRLTTELEMREQTISKLKDELQEKNAFIDDLKSALRSQESVFQEMLKTTEQLRLAEGSRNQMEKQVELLRVEVKHLENLLKQKEESYTKEMATKLSELHESHSKEVESLKEAFAQYDAQITNYVENLEKEKDREAQNWNEKERLLQKQIKSQQDEITELMTVLASQPEKNSSATLHLPTEGKEGIGRKSIHGLLSSQEKRQTPRRSRQTTPAAFTTPALEFRLASLEEELARNRLREKVGRYAKTRRRTLQSSSFVKRKNNNDNDDDSYNDNHNSDTNEDDGDMKSEHVDHRGTHTNSGVSPGSSSRRFHTPHVGAITRGEENSSLPLSPKPSRGTRNRAIL
ncbi:uncharacterized protein TM35_000034390 [Trypanosoma theileri]|uniref:Uncharacterized protein n=1 Tax=Trypanosoma theileri TaxID=67003 RepID=A0A1X0P6W7_9TRYP|nr:uncharacterized protein TM35_000034390 [Trypanosoma theileri]ORC92686.1 hypothetical protein TM35_000034390 [Trypanosoma theileri]